MRLKIENLNEAIEKLTGVELSLYVYIVQRSDRVGLLHRLKMSETIMAIMCSKQGFYDALKKLEEKRFLHIDHYHDGYFNLLLIGNSFASESDSTEPYLNLNFNLLNSTMFHRLPANIKKFLLRALSFSVQNKWKVSQDTLKKYKVLLEDLKEYFEISTISEGMYYLRLRYEYRRQTFNVLFNHIKHRLLSIMQKVKMHYTRDSLYDATQVLSNFREYQGLITVALSSPEHKYLIQPKLLTYIINKKRNELAIYS